MIERAIDSPSTSPHLKLALVDGRYAGRSLTVVVVAVLSVLSGVSPSSGP